VQALRDRDQHVAGLERARRAALRREEQADRRRRDGLKAELRDVASRADPSLHSWLASDRFALALSATTGARAIELAPLHLTSTWGTSPRFWHERGEHRLARSQKFYVVGLGPVLRFRWAAKSLGGCGGGFVQIRPRSFGALAGLDLRSRISWPGQEDDVLSVALRVARIVADGELEEVVALSLARRARGDLL
jgi:hypothetical protein